MCTGFYFFMAFMLFGATFFLALTAAPFLPPALLDLATGFLAPTADFLAVIFFPADFLTDVFFPADAPLAVFFPTLFLATFFGALDAALPELCFCWALSFFAAALAASAKRLFSS